MSLLLGYNQMVSKYFRLLCIVAICAYFWYCAKTYTEWHFIDNVNLIFHEAGHTIFSFLGMFSTIAAGSAFQIAIPLFIASYFFLSEQKISGALCLLWVGQNFLNVSVYAGDAIPMQFNLLGGDDVIHDWNYLLNSTGLLNYVSAIASAMQIAGLIIIFVGTVLSIHYWRQSIISTMRRVL